VAVFKTTYRVVWADVDGAQVVHHANYFRLFERAEEEFYEHLGLGFNYFIEHGFWLPRIGVFCRYRAPSRLADRLEISLSIEEIKEKAVKYGFIVKKDADVFVAEGYVVAVAADKEFGRAISLPLEVVEKLEAFKTG